MADRALASVKQVKELQKAAKEAKANASGDALGALVQDARLAKGGYPVVIANIGSADSGAMRNAWDVIKSRMSAPGAAVLIAVNNDKPIMLAAGTDEAVAAGFNAGAVIKAIAPCVAGGGGGKPSMAHAGGKDVSGIEAALDAAAQMLL